MRGIITLFFSVWSLFVFFFITLFGVNAFKCPKNQMI